MQVRRYKNSEKVAKKAEYLYNKLKLVFVMQNSGATKTVKTSKSATNKENLKEVTQKKITEKPAAKEGRISCSNHCLLSLYKQCST